MKWNEIYWYCGQVTKSVHFEAERQTNAIYEWRSMAVAKWRMSKWSHTSFFLAVYFRSIWRDWELIVYSEIHLCRSLKQTKISRKLANEKIMGKHKNVHMLPNGIFKMRGEKKWKNWKSSIYCGNGKQQLAHLFVQNVINDYSTILINTSNQFQFVLVSFFFFVGMYWQRRPPAK